MGWLVCCIEKKSDGIAATRVVLYLALDGSFESSDTHTVVACTERSYGSFTCNEIDPCFDSQGSETSRF